MKANMDNIPDLIQRLEPLTEIDTVGCSDDLKQRLDILKECVIRRSFQPSIDASLSGSVGILCQRLPDSHHLERNQKAGNFGRARSMRRRSRTSRLPLHLTFMISRQVPSFCAFYVCIICSVCSSIIAFPSKFWWIKHPQKVWRIISL
jgi:hypothetical protein